ncbi:MAG: long-chain fatty acid--CoA ligase [Acidobacteriia bacterium]|nr:long-chain fatty acid--CoA ligase [Terriglobia bacterium]
MQSTMMDFPLTLTAILERSGKLFPKVEIVSRMPDRQLHRTNYGEFYRRSRALAEALTRSGLKRGDRVATLMWNHSRHLEAYFGIPAAGGVIHTLNLRLAPDDLVEIINDAEDSMLIVDDILLPLYEKVRDKTKIGRVLVVPLSGQRVSAGYENYEDFLKQASGDFQYPELDEREAAAMCYTSGTTGMPKGVVYSHRALVLHTFGVGLGDTFGLKQLDVIMPVVPMFHVNAWGLPFLAVMIGSKLVLPGPLLDAASLLDLMEQEKVTLSAGVPTIWMGILESIEKNSGKWKLQPGLRMVVGGAAAPEAMIRRFDKQGIMICHAWGMTETTPLGTGGRLKSYMRDASEDERYATRAKQGLPFPFIELRTVSESGEAPWDGQTMGELQVRGPWVASNYYKEGADTDKWTVDGWFRTGDVATIDPEGYMKITDRTKDLIKSGGEWISSVDLENALMGHPAVKEAAVVAIPHPKWQERPLAAVVLKEGMQATAEELRAHLAGKFAKWQLPEALVFVDAIPRNSTGKFMKAKLREQYAGWKWNEESESK